ncbi:hypothetical protein N7462_009239 [Penicillium macrosclerotiorum]|uniref:uncharacterized protein n=1 Tax=Penicillium macrosclerotiorum TaxID=303699 RepID=UPI0025488B0C|nr:uncharacterized protein N7462_009239 [Penicillium macrosclerotiorum]KAJ5673800.1 hypothetical protein N7462_009239 [Penicillium macrosclerotiorum]
MPSIRASIVATLAVLAPATLSRATPLTGQLNLDTIPEEVSYFYKEQNVPLSLFTERYDSNFDFRTRQLSCGQDRLGDCPPLQSFCYQPMKRCMVKGIIGMKCNSNDSCFSGLCGQDGLCERPKGQFGTLCTEQSDCNSDLVCRISRFDPDSTRCLDKRARGVGDVCKNDNDCDRPLTCKETKLPDGRSICTLAREDSQKCMNAGMLCGSGSQCCSGRCMLSGIMPSCA